MSKIVLLVTLLLVLLGTTTAGAQSYYQKEASLYAEIFGTGGEVSLHFEKIVAGKFTFRTGLGLTGVSFRKGYTIPFGMSVLLGKDRNFIELGGGGAWMDFDNNGTDAVLFDLKEDQLVGHAMAGYRFIGDYGLTYRLAFTPAFTKDGFKPMGGAAFGKSF